MSESAQDNAAFGADGWWEEGGKHRLLQAINPIRLKYIDEKACGLGGQKVLDAGCGGGILAEAMAGKGAQVTGIDVSEDAIGEAKRHAEKAGLSVEYLAQSCEDHASTSKNGYDVIACMEMVEHVRDPGETIAQLSAMLRKDGSLVLSTINRTPLAGALMIGALEGALGVLDRGTHEYRKFRTPTEVGSWCEQAGLRVLDVVGMNWSFFGKTFLLSRSFMPVNYFLHAKKA